MLILTRRKGQRIRLKLSSGETIWLAVEEHRGELVRIGIDAPPSVNIMREEILPPEELATAPTRDVRGRQERKNDRR